MRVFLFLLELLSPINNDAITHHIYFDNIYVLFNLVLQANGQSLDYSKCLLQDKYASDKLAEILLDACVLDIRIKLRSFHSKGRLYCKIGLISFHKDRMIQSQ